MNVDFRETLEKDLDFVLKLESEKENAQFIGSWSLDTHKDSRKKSDIRHMIIYDKNTNQSIGYIILRGFESENNALEIMRIVSSVKGKGVGRKSLEKIKHIAFVSNSFNKLWLDVRCDNERAKYLYQSCGFKIEAHLRDSVYSNNKYHDLYLLSILKREYDK